MNHPNQYSAAHVYQQAAGATVTHNPPTLTTSFSVGHYIQMDESSSEASSGFAQTVRQIDDEFYRTFPDAKNSSLVVLPSAQWVYDRASGQYVQYPEVMYPVVRDSDYPPCFTEEDSRGKLEPSEQGMAQDAAVSSSQQQPQQYQSQYPVSSPGELYYDYHAEGSASSTFTAANRLPSPEYPRVSSAEASYPYDAQQSTTSYELRSAPPAVEEVPPHLIVPSQQPMFDFRPEIRRQQQWGSEINMYDPYPRAAPEREQPYVSNHLPSPQLSDPLSPISPASPMTPMHTEHHMPMLLDDWRFHQQVDKSAESSLPPECEEGPSSEWPSSVYPSPGIGSGQRLLAPGHDTSPSPSPSSHTLYCSSFRKHRNPHVLGHSQSHISRPYHTHPGHRYKPSSHRLLGTPGYSSRARRSPSPRLASSCSVEPEPSSSMPLSPLSEQKKPSEKKPPLACLFCRGRKIACGPPLPGSKDRTCNQCQRRSLKCEYPLESRRGMRKKKVPPSTESTTREESSAPTINPLPSVPATPVTDKKILDNVSHDAADSDAPRQVPSDPLVSENS